MSKTVRDYVLDIVKEATDRGLVLEEEDVHYSDGLFYIDGMEASEWLKFMSMD